MQKGEFAGRAVRAAATFPEPSPVQLCLGPPRLHSNQCSNSDGFVAVGGLHPQFLHGREHARRRHFPNSLQTLVNRALHR